MLHERYPQMSCRDCEFCRNGDDASDCCCCRRASSSWFSIVELLEGLAPEVIRFLNQVAWSLGLPLFEFPEDSMEAPTLLVTPKRKRYATLLADTISVLACRNCKHQWRLIHLSWHYPEMGRYINENGMQKLKIWSSNISVHATPRTSKPY